MLFSKPYDESFYNQVITACALKSDLEIFPANDMTEIGENGINFKYYEDFNNSTVAGWLKNYYRIEYKKKPMYLYNDLFDLTYFINSIGNI